MSRVNLNDALGTGNNSGSGAVAVSLPSIPVQATRAVVQFYTNAAGIAAIGPANLATTPLVNVTDDGSTPDQGFTGVVGLRLFNMASVEVIGKNNLANFKYIPFANGYTVYCQTIYYK